MKSNIKIVLGEGDKYKINFDSDNGRITGTITIALDGLDLRSPHERRQAAAAQFKVLADELCAAMETYEA